MGFRLMRKTLNRRFSHVASRFLVAAKRGIYFAAFAAQNPLVWAHGMFPLAGSVKSWYAARRSKRAVTDG